MSESSSRPTAFVPRPMRATRFFGARVTISTRSSAGTIGFSGTSVTSGQAGAPISADYERLSPPAGRLQVRTIGYSTSEDFIHWTPLESALMPDSQDPVDLQFYGMPATKYEQHYLGFPWLFRTHHLTMDSGLRTVETERPSAVLRTGRRSCRAARKGHGRAPAST